MPEQSGSESLFSQHFRAHTGGRNWNSVPIPLSAATNSRRQLARIPRNATQSRRGHGGVQGGVGGEREESPFGYFRAQKISAKNTLASFVPGTFPPPPLKKRQRKALSRSASRGTTSCRRTAASCRGTRSPGARGRPRSTRPSPEARGCWSARRRAGLPCRRRGWRPPRFLILFREGCVISCTCALVVWLVSFVVESVFFAYFFRRQGGRAMRG